MRPVLSHLQSRKLLENRGRPSCNISIDLGLSEIEACIRDNGVDLLPGVVVSWAELEKLRKSTKKCIVSTDDGWKDVRAHSETTGWVRSLCPTSGAPTTLVSGFPMHRIKDTDPWEDTKTKINALGKIHGRVLDTATGLGYTAIQAAEKADELITVELDPTAIEIARMNPWSAKLFDDDKITQLIGDVAELIYDFPTDHFSAVVHDPPTIQFAGDLYSQEFYIQLRRVLKSNGRLFHYVADPDSRQGEKLTAGVIRRLKDAGFKTVRRQPEAFGVVAS